jgi:RecA-family ATPase
MNDQIRKITIMPFEWTDPKDIPPRRFVYGKHYMRRVVSHTVGAPGTGKSSLSIVEALAIVTGRPLLGVKPDERTRVWLYNGGEDEDVELKRRVAATGRSTTESTRASL